MPRTVLGPLFLLASCISFSLAACQEYASYQDVGTTEPNGEEPPSGCDGGDCHMDEDWGTDSCCAPDGDREGEDGGTCLVPEPLPVELTLCHGACPTWTDFDLEGAARVVFKQNASLSDPHSLLVLAMQGQRSPVEIRARLPEGVDLPVEVGDAVGAAAVIQVPWWKNQAVTLRSPDGNELYTQTDQSGQWSGAPVLCPPAPDERGCGLVVFPVLDIEGIILSQGKTGSYSLNGRAYRYWVGRLEQYQTMECDDVPMGWIQLAYLTHTLRSACRCQDDIDCAQGEICEPYAKKCVPDPCATMRCASGHVCDPFRGECVPRPAWGCDGDLDCGQDEICHPITHACVQDFCRFVDCAPCSPLLGGCYGCLHDCDCGLGLCDRQARSCVDGCVESKLGPRLVPENPQRFELYYACLEDAIDDPGAVLRLIEPAAQCGLSPLPNTCPRAGQVVCLVPLERYPNQARITQECWARLCALSQNPLVQNLVGGYYLP